MAFVRYIFIAIAGVTLGLLIGFVIAIATKSPPSIWISILMPFTTIMALGYASCRCRWNTRW
jgi:ABC-type arginine transport system permease subunit